MQEFKEDLKELKELTLELVKQSVEHNTLLKQHEARSLALQAAQDKLDVRLEPVEDHVRMINTVGKILAAVAGSLIVPIILKYVFGLL